MALVVVAFLADLALLVLLLVAVLVLVVLLVLVVVLVVAVVVFAVVLRWKTRDYSMYSWYCCEMWKWLRSRCYECYRC